MLKSIIKVVAILTGIEGILFLGMTLTAMTDEKPPVIGKAFYWSLKYIFGFPLVLFNQNYPFFLDNKHMPAAAVILIILNNLILAFIILLIIKKIFK